MPKNQNHPSASQESAHPHAEKPASLGDRIRSLFSKDKAKIQELEKENKQLKETNQAAKGEIQKLKSEIREIQQVIENAETEEN